MEESFGLGLGRIGDQRAFRESLTESWDLGLGLFWGWEVGVWGAGSARWGRGGIWGAGSARWGELA